MCALQFAFSYNLQVGRDGAMQLVSEEMSQRYDWSAVAFPTMMEDRGFSKTDGLKGYYYRLYML